MRGVLVLMLLITAETSTGQALETTTASFDPCNNYKILDDSWRSQSQINSYNFSHDDTLVDWSGWYRFYLDGESAQMSEWCLSTVKCGGETGLYLNGSHPTLEDGVMTIAVLGTASESLWSNCGQYVSPSIQVKACAGGYYVYELVKPDVSIPGPTYCTVAFESITEDPCNDYQSLDRPWRATNQSGSYVCDESFTWNGWYRLFYNGMNIQMPNSCVTSSGCDTFIDLWLNGPEPQVEDGVVIMEVCGSTLWSGCCDYKAPPIRVKACPGNYYVYELVNPDLRCSGYCTDINTIEPVVYPVTPAVSTYSINTVTPAVSTSHANTIELTAPPVTLAISTSNVNTFTPVVPVTPAVSTSNINTTPPVVYPVTPIVSTTSTNTIEPVVYPVTPAVSTTSTNTIEPVVYPGTPVVSTTSTNTIEPVVYPVTPAVSSYDTFETDASTVTPDVSISYSDSDDPCDSYHIIDDYWRRTDNYWFWYGYKSGHDDTLVDWNGWYRFFLKGSSAQIPEWCFSQMSCGGYTALWLGGPHPQIEDGVVTRDVFGGHYDQCSLYKSEPIQVKACPGNYYVYELTRPTLSIPAPTYCADFFNTPSVDPCHNYTSLDEIWRDTNYAFTFLDFYGTCDYNVDWNGWYRLMYEGQSAQMPESCVGVDMCGTQQPLWLNGSHPSLEDGVVTLQVCVSTWNGCCDLTSHPIQVKACPGNYYVYEFVKPVVCAAYCEEVPSSTTSSTTTELISEPDLHTTILSTTAAPPVDPCLDYSVLDDSWRSTSNQFSSEIMCDTSVSWNGWYRLYLEGQSVQMPDTCVAEYSCGTSAPLWLSGGHPTVEEGIVSRNVCGNWANDCCYFQSNPINVKACPDNYYVYEFVSPTTCDLAYCAENMTFTTVNPSTTTTTESSTTDIEGLMKSTFVTPGTTTTVAAASTTTTTESSVTNNKDEIQNSTVVLQTSSTTTTTEGSATNIAGFNCTENSHFEFQGTSCPATCSNPFAPVNCSLPNQNGCICDDGYLLSSGQCVSEENCGCIFEGFYYSDGQSMVLDEDCGRQCVCSAGAMICSEYQCASGEECGLINGVRGCRSISYATCSVEGLGSYYTFDGHTFRYPGACQLTLARVMGPSQLPHFVLAVQKVPRALLDFARFLNFETGGSKISIEIGQPSNVQVDGQMVGLPTSIGSDLIQIFHSSVMGLVVKTNFGVTVRADGTIVRITVPISYNGSLGGLCGNLNGNADDEFYAPNGNYLNDSKLFADSWRDGSLSAYCAEPNNTWQQGDYQNRSQLIELCSIMARDDGPFAECSMNVDPWERIDNCIFMLEQTTGASDALCVALQGYTLLCQQNGIGVGEWRNLTNCESTCPQNSHYELCGTSCAASCPSLSFPFQCTILCQEGCQCNDGQVLDGDSCVSPTNCGCFHSGRYRQPGEQFWEGEECRFQCVCDGLTGNVNCTSASCSEQEACTIEDGQYGCHPHPSGICYASGDPHYISFDGTMFDFQGTCQYVLAKLCTDNLGLEPFEVDARNQQWFYFPVSITVDVFVNVYGHRIHLSMEMISYSVVMVNDEIKNLPVLLDSGRVSIYTSGSLIYVVTDFGLTVSYGGNYAVTVVVPAHYSGATCGLCGNFNDQSDDDFLTPSGELVTSAVDFGNQWMAGNASSCNSVCVENCECTDEIPAFVMCEIITNTEGPFSFCHALVDPQPYFDDCVNDVCLSGNSQEVLCLSVQSYVSACHSVNAIVYPWREQASCVLNCPANITNSHYELCGTDCGHTCASSIDSSCQHTCSEGCFCDDGFFKSGGLCVPVEQCGCLYDGFYYKIGQQFWNQDCSQNCECFAPNDLRCSASSCPPSTACVMKDGYRGCYNKTATCAVWGDPHYITFDGAVSHFQGTCSYEIAQTCRNITENDLAFRVVATNSHRGNMMVSFVSVVDVWLSQNGETTHITFGQNRRVKVAGKDINNISNFNSTDLVEVHEEQGYMILNASNDFIVRFDGNSNLLVQVSRRFFESVCGMCGNFNGDPADDKATQNGELTPDDTSFGQSWKSDISVPGCGAKDQSPDPDDCPSSQAFSDLCGIISNISGPFQSCHQYVNPEPYFFSCVYDMCLYRHTESMLCSAVEAYESACASSEVQIPEWRSHLHCDLRDCSGLHCSDDEWCGEMNGLHGCFCNDDNPSSEPFDYFETCESSTGFMSLSRCLLFEAGFPAEMLHLNDPSCKGTVRNGRVEFHFDNEDHICGTSLLANGTHFIYSNFIKGGPEREGLINRKNSLKLPFKCIYPQSKKLSMNVQINGVGGFVERNIAGEGKYQVLMVPYQDAEFNQPFTGEVDAELDQEMFVEVFVEGVDARQFALVMDSCWATPENDPDDPLRWDLVVHECPNPNDGTVKLLQNGVSTISRFSFKMFIFNTNSTMIYLHCAVHLCLLKNGHCSTNCFSKSHHHRERRSLNFHDSASLSMGPLVSSQGNSETRVLNQLRTSNASHLPASLKMILFLFSLCYVF